MSTGDYLMVWLRAVECGALIPSSFLRWRRVVIATHIAQQILAKTLAILDLVFEFDVQTFMAIRSAWKGRFVERVVADLEHCAVDAC